MERQLLVQATQPQPSVSPRRDSLIREWLFRFSVNASEALTPERASALAVLWTEAFADLPDAVLEHAFRKTLNECKFWPKVADVLEHVEHAQTNAAEEEAAQKWTRVLDYIRVFWNPDIPPKNAPRITERTRRAINAAGGLAYLADCARESLQWARKRFIEAYIRYGELQQDEYLLPAGEVRDLLEACAKQKQLPGPDVYETSRAIGESYRERLGEHTTAVRQLAASTVKTEPRPVIATSQRLELLARQRAAILAKSSPDEIRRAEQLRVRCAR